jgi:ADP-dependent phosphofructokinase/glucokinase
MPLIVRGDREMDVYQEAVGYFEKISDSRLVACGLTSNLDIILKWDQKAIQKWVDRYATGPRNLYKVETLSDFVDMLLYVLPVGGTECYISEEVAHAVESVIEQASLGIGGTGIQAACALSSIGVRTLVHTTALAPQFCSLLDYPGLSVVKNGAAYSVRELLQEPGENYFPHFILQFGAGDGFDFNGRSYRAPASNKVILSFDRINTIVPIDHSFFAYASGRPVTSMLISGLTGIQSAGVLDERLDEVSHLLGDAGASFPILLECGPSALPGGLHKILKRLGPQADIISCSDEELFGLNGALTGEVRDDVDALAEMALSFGPEYRPRLGVVIHTKDVSVFCGDAGRINMGSALAMGNLVASAKARFANYGSREEVLALAGEPFSRAALQKAEALRLKGIFAVPTKAIEHPACTIGLGDSFAAGLLSCLGSASL